MEMPDDDRDVIITMADGREIIAHHDGSYMPDGMFVDENYNACGCDACGSAYDTRPYYPVSWREIP